MSLSAAQQRTVAMASLLLASAGCTAAAPKPPPDSQAASAGYHVVHGWPQLPEGRDLGEVSGVGVDGDGNVFVFHRNDQSWPASNVLSLDPIKSSTVTVFDGRAGAIVAEWGANAFAMPHGLTVDADGNVWLTDVALQQVFKYSRDGKPLMTLGERGWSSSRPMGPSSSSGAPRAPAPASSTWSTA